MSADNVPPARGFVKAIEESIRRATQNRPANVGEMSLNWVPDAYMCLRKNLHKAVTPYRAAAAAPP